MWWYPRECFILNVMVDTCICTINYEGKNENSLENITWSILGKQQAESVLQWKILINETIKIELQLWKIWEADVSSISPTSQRIAEAFRIFHGVIRPLSTLLIKPNFHVSLSHRRSATFSLESSNLFIAILCNLLPRFFGRVRSGEKRKQVASEAETFCPQASSDSLQAPYQVSEKKKLL